MSSVVGKWEVEEATVYPAIEDDTGLVVKSPAAHHAISVPFPTSLDNTGKTLVVQYEVSFPKRAFSHLSATKLIWFNDHFVG